jgi:ADP-ribose pyrophosphatase YjhB (NUDIX family)/catechol 2,3-dioxygenase-like lactoylglutathione lyase family enzyme
VTDIEPWRHCPRCAGELARDDDGRAVTCTVCGAREYGNPAPTVSAIPVDLAGRLLLARRAREPRAGYWDALGGFVERDESGSDALVREVREETGAEFVALAFLGAFSDTYGPGGPPTFNLYWTARHVSGQLEPDDDVAELRWFEPAELPPDEEMAFPNNVVAIRAALNTGFAREQAPDAQPPSMFEIQLVTEEIERLAAFYAETLDLQVIVGDAERGRVHLGLREGQLILAHVEGEAASPDWPGLPPPLVESGDATGPTPRSHGPVHFALQVSGRELIEAGERLRSEGLDVRGPFRWPDGYRSTYFRDPDQNVVELIAPPSG